MTPGLRPGADVHPPEIAALCHVAGAGVDGLLHHDRHPKIGNEGEQHGADEPARGDADDGEGMPFDPDGLAGDRGIAMEAPLPEAVVQHANRFCARLAIFFRKESAADHGMDTEA